MGIITPLMKFTGLFMLAIEAVFPGANPKVTDANSAVEVEIGSWNFETGEQGWSSQSNGNKEWKLTEDGHLAYIEEECFFEIFCWDEEYNFHSNDDSRFFLVNSSSESGDFKDVNFISPGFSTLGTSSIKVSFYHHFGNNDDAGFIEYKTARGEWTKIQEYTATQGDHDNFEKVEIILPEDAENKSDVKIRFRYDGADGDRRYWAVDNVKINGIENIPPDYDCDALNAQIRANFCAVNAHGGEVIELSALLEPISENSDDLSYTWFYNGVEMDEEEAGNQETIQTNVAGTYTVEITDENNCSVTASITTAEELVKNGNFEDDYVPGSFETDYDYVEFSNTPGNLLGPEGRFAVDYNAHNYHSSFYGRDHTTGNGKFLMVNGSTSGGKVIWKNTIENIQPHTDYYFSAWAMNLNPQEPAELQFKLNGELIGVSAVLEEADKPTSPEEVNRGNWVQFYKDSWNSGEATEVILEIVNLNTAAGGNDFGIDDISFGNLDPLPFSIDPPERIEVCSGHNLELFANIEGGREPEFTWTEPGGEIVSTEENPVIEDITEYGSGIYTLSVRDFYGCESETAEVEVIVREDCNTIDFDGQDDYVLIGDHYNFNSSFSLEAWIKPHSVSGKRSILSKGDFTKPEAGGYELFIENGFPVFRINERRIISPYQVDTERWYHLAAVFDGKEARIYVDGIEIESKNVKAPLVVSHPFIIGAFYNSTEDQGPENHFHGWIEETRIWRLALSEEQIRFMMNQRLNNDNEWVEGKKIPLPAPGDLASESLTGYYQLLSNEAEDGITEDLAGDKADGFLLNMRTQQENTAPLPYFSSQDGNWLETSGESPWKYGETVWDHPNSTGINGDLINWNIAEVHHNIYSREQINLLGLLLEDGILDMSGEYHESGSFLSISKYLGLNGIIDLNGESQLIQPEGSIISEESTGHIERDQQGTASSYNYNYWSSPVLASSGNANYKVAEVLFDGTNIGTGMAEPINFGNPYAYADRQKQSPIRISNYWINAFRRKRANEYYDWEHVGSNKIGLKPGEGFTMKGTEDVHVNEGQIQNYTFKGFPNNGDIVLPDVLPDQNYLIGNPYPSAIDADKFILAHLNARGGKNHNNVFNGALYFWDHFAGKTHLLSGYIGGYSVYNLSGGISALSVDERINNRTGKKGTKKPNRYIPVGQAFFINTAGSVPQAQNNFITGGTVTFKNEFRVFMPEEDSDSDNDNPSQFLKPENPSKRAENFYKPDNRYKIRLEFDSPTGYNRQLLATADAYTTRDFDLGYDAPIMDNAKEDMFWMIKDEEYVIQGVPNFNIDQVLALGVKIDEEGEFSIKIEKLENLPDHVDIYLRDNKDSSYFDLKKDKFTDSIQPGYYDERFDIVFQKENRSEENETAEELEEEAFAVDYFQDSREIYISNPDLEDIEKILVYSLLGQEMKSFDLIPTQKEILLPLEGRFSTAVYFLKVFTPDKTYIKKIIIEK